MFPGRYRWRCVPLGFLVALALSGASASARPSDPAPRQGATFEIGQLHRNFETGTGRLAVTAPAAGDLFLHGVGLLPIDRQPMRAGTVRFPVILTGEAKRRLLSAGSATVRVKVTFTPEGGPARTKTKLLTLRAALPK